MAMEFKDILCTLVCDFGVGRAVKGVSVRTAEGLHGSQSITHASLAAQLSLPDMYGVI